MNKQNFDNKMNQVSLGICRADRRAACGGAFRYAFTSPRMISFATTNLAWANGS